MFQSLWNRAMSFDEESQSHFNLLGTFQSLWNRAMSFDKTEEREFLIGLQVSIPLEQGNVFRQKLI